MTKTKWFKSPPPSIGWWPASTIKDTNAICWWDGVKWSYTAYPTDTAREAAIAAKISFEYDQKYVEWTERWWL